MAFLIQSWLIATVRLELEALERYLDTVGAAFETERRELQARYDSEKAALSAEHSEEYIDDEGYIDDVDDRYSDEWYYLADRFPRLFLNSLFVTLISMVEHELQALVRHAERQHKKQLGKCVKSGGMSTLESFAAYLSKVPGVTYPSTSAEWKRLLIYNRVRNAIVHQYGEASKGTNAEATAFLNAAGAIDAKDGKTILLTEAVCKNAMKDIRTFFDQLVAGLPKGLDV